MNNHALTSTAASRKLTFKLTSKPIYRQFGERTSAGHAETPLSSSKSRASLSAITSAERRMTMKTISPLIESTIVSLFPGTEHRPEIASRPNLIFSLVFLKQMP